MASYRHIFADLLTNQILAELPLTAVQYTQALNAAGIAQGSLQISGLNALATNVLSSTIPNKCAWFIDRDGVIVWGGLINGRRYDSKTQTLTLRAAEFESYFLEREIKTTVVYTATDQLTIAQALITTAQASVNGNIGVQTRGEVSGVLINQTWYGYQQKSVMSALQDLSKAVNGFDFNIFCSYDANGNIIKTLRLGYPRYGKLWSATSQTSTVIELPANLANYTYDQDGTKAANTITATGSGSNEGMLTTTVQDATKIAAGWALTEMSSSYPAIADPTVLATLANGQLMAVSSPVETFQASLPASADPILGSYEVGDDVRLRISDDFFNQLDTIYRLVALTVTAGETSQEMVTMTLTVKTS